MSKDINFSSFQFCNGSTDHFLQFSYVELWRFNVWILHEHSLFSFWIWYLWHRLWIKDKFSLIRGKTYSSGLWLKLVKIYLDFSFWIPWFFFLIEPEVLGRFKHRFLGRNSIFLRMNRLLTPVLKMNVYFN